MMEFVFLACWTTGFMAGGFLIARLFINRTRLYLLMILNLAFLAGLFHFYPLVLESRVLP